MVRVNADRASKRKPRCSVMPSTKESHARFVIGPQRSLPQPALICIEKLTHEFFLCEVSCHISSQAVTMPPKRAQTRKSRRRQAAQQQTQQQTQNQVTPAVTATLISQKQSQELAQSLLLGSVTILRPILVFIANVVLSFPQFFAQGNFPEYKTAVALSDCSSGT